MGRCGCHELTTKTKQTKKQQLPVFIGSINTTPDMNTNISVGCHSFGYFYIILDNIIVRST